MTSTVGQIANVAKAALGDELAADAAAGATVLPLDDTATFDDVTGGTLRVGGDDPAAQVVAYTAVDDDQALVTLAAPLAAAWPAGTRVDLWDTTTNAPAVEWRAQVAQAGGDPGADDALDAAVAYPLIPLLPEGIRDAGAGEVVTLEQVRGEWVVADVRGRTPQIAGDMLAPGSVVPEALGFTVDGMTATVAAAAPTDPAVNDLWFDAGNGYLMRQWDGTAWQPYQLGSGALAPGSVQRSTLGFTIADQTTSVGAAPAAPKTGDLWFDVANGYRLNQWDGAAWQPAALGSNALAAGSITSGLLAAGAVVAGKIAADAITANEIAAGAVSTSELAANAITADKVQAGQITSTLLAAGAVVAGKIAAGAVSATELAAGAVVAGKIAAGAVSTAALAAGAVQAGTIAAGAITADALAVDALDAKSITGASITGDFHGTVSSTGSVPTTILGALLDGCTIDVDSDSGAILIYAAPGAATVTTFTVAGNASWTCPAGVTSAKVELWGGGGGGEGYNGIPTGGGGGGEYAAHNALPVTPGQAYNMVVGGGGAAGLANSAGNAQVPPGTAGNGGDTTFTGSTVLTAHGGKGAKGNSSAGGAGGTGSTAPVHYGGGAGGTNGGQGPYAGSGGGSSAGTSAPGNVGGAGGIGPGAGGAAPTGGGAGGAGGNPASGTAGSAGSAPGGGGGGGTQAIGSGTMTNGGAGARGQVRITTTVGAGVLVGSISATGGTDQYGNVYPAGVYLGLGSQATTDLNTCTAPGRYYATPTTSNCPTTVAYYVVDVLPRNDGTWIVQMAYRIGTGDNPELWLRQWSSTGGWKPWYQLFSDTGPLSTVAVAVSPHTITGTVRRVGPTVQAAITITLGAAVSVPANGDIGNTDVATIPVGYRPGQSANMSNAGTGPVVHGQCATGGQVQLTSVAPGVTLASGSVVQLCGTWLAA